MNFLISITPTVKTKMNSKLLTIMNKTKKFVSSITLKNQERNPRKMVLAHLHPIIVHLTLTLGVGWCLWDLFRILTRNEDGERWETNGGNFIRPLEGLIILLIITVCTGWVALSMKEREMGPGSIFTPGETHGNAALLTLSILIVRFFIAQKTREGLTNTQGRAFRKPLSAVLSLLALSAFMMTGILGERLVFHYGVTAERSGVKKIPGRYASKAFFKSKIRSSGSSSPTDTLKKPGSIPRAARSSAVI